jgi:hypothetical protein
MTIIDGELLATTRHSWQAPIEQVTRGPQIRRRNGGEER